MYPYDLATINYAANLGILFLLVFLHQNNRMSKKLKKHFYLLIGLELIEMFVYSAELITSTFSYPTMWRILFSVIGYSVRPFLLYIIFQITLRDYQNKKCKMLLAAPAFFNVLVVSTAFYTDVCFAYTQTNQFVRGPLGYITHITLTFYLLILLIYTTRQSIRHKNFEQVIVYMMAAVIAGSVLVEAIFFVRNIGRTSVVLCTVFYYMFFQTEEDKRKIAREDERIKGLMTQNQLDSMTGLLNKEAFGKACRHILEREKCQTIAFLFIDLDHFKALNDTLGHAVGDKAILDSAQKIAANFRQSDKVCRFGGDEFCVFLRDISESGLRDRLAACRTALQQEYWNAEHSMRVLVTSSIGAIYCDKAPMPSYDELIATADQAVYEAKSTGRNRYVLNKRQPPCALPKAQREGDLR